MTGWQSFAIADVQALGWSLLHFVWQGACVAAILAAFDLAARRSAPIVRYRAAAAALAAMVALPAVTFFALRGSAGVVPALAAPGAAAPAAIASPARAFTARASAAETLRRRVDAALPWFVVAWGMGVAFLSARGIGGWAVAQRVRRSGVAASRELELRLARLARTLRVSAPVRLYTSALVEVPTVIGALRPVVLLPASAVTGLSPEQVELILAHELAHVRRADYLVNLLQTAAETLLFYHPAVWWASHRMRVEREHCCDDLAVAASGDAAGYARALATLEELRGATPSFAMAATGGSLFARIARLAGAPQPRAARGLAGATAAALLAVVAGGSFLFAETAPRVKQEPEPIVAADEDAETSTAATWDAGEQAPTSRASQTPERRRSGPRAAAGEATGAQDRAFPLRRIVDMARVGVTPEYIDEMAAVGYPSLDVDRLIELRTHGVEPDFVRGLAAEGFTKLDPGQLLELRDHGVTPDFVHGIREQGLQKLSLDELRALRDQGVTPEFVAGMKQAGLGPLSLDALVELRNQGVDVEYARTMKMVMKTDVSMARLLELRNSGVSAEYLREMKDLGYALDLKAMIEVRNAGVTPDFVHEMKALGYGDLPLDTLVELRNHGVTPDYVRELGEAGASHLSIRELIELRDSGVHPELVKRLEGRTEKEGRR